MKLSSIKINKSLLKDILVETWRGKNMDRLLLNNALRSIELSGDILDLGSGGTKASYHRFIKFIKSYKITHTDLYKNIDQPDILKIDGSLVKNIVTDPYSLNVLETIITFAKKEKLQVIAEFVENEEIFNIINALGIDFSQGYYFAKPEPLESISK